MVTRVFYPKFSEAEYAQRWTNIRNEMRARNLDCLVIYGAYGSTFGTDAGQQNLRYVTNFADQLHAYCVFPLAGEPTLLNSFAGHIATGRDISVVPDIRFAHLDMAAKVAEVLREKGVDKAHIGIVGINFARGISIPHDHYVSLTRHLPQAEFTVTTDVLEKVRRIKSDEEIDYLRKGAAITDRAFEAQVRAIRPGARNIDLFNAVLAETHAAGGTLSLVLLGSTPMSNPNMSFPDPYISDRALSRGDVVVNESSSAYNGYSGQMLRTVFLGKPTKDYERMFELGLGVFHKLKSILRPGATTSDITEAVQPIVDAGLTITAPAVHGWANFVEPPIIGMSTTGHGLMDWTFQKGETIVVQPNPVTPDKRSGTFIGDLCVITEDGCESLHTYPTDELLVVDGF